MERKIRDSCRKAWHGRPRRCAEEAPDRPRKASAWSGNQRSHFTNPEKTVGKQLLSSFEQKGSI
ncbi:hypothetical protein ACIP97_04160 [Peribacillus frigoritolerans]|uniref:hypothetical protein n=1 Tax=Peribacillus frigoritolerans TaxID=450367 RepID=UPI0038065440